jgi:hypothetical protein
VFLCMYSDCTNYVDPHTIIQIFLIFWLYFMFLLIDGCVLFLCSILAVDIFIISFVLFAGLLRTLSGYIIGLIFLACYT